MKGLLLAHVDAEGRHDFGAPDNPLAPYRALGSWMRTADPADLTEDSQFVSQDEIGEMLLQHARTQPTPPRLAVVLSGGGAKCAYQVGAICALEEKLAELRQANRLDGLDIALVVGTSGGAINAVPVALGITASPEGRSDFQQTWAELDQRDIVRPSVIVRGNIGLWFALVNIGLVLGPCGVLCQRTNAVPCWAGRSSRWRNRTGLRTGSGTSLALVGRKSSLASRLALVDVWSPRLPVERGPRGSVHPPCREEKPRAREAVRVPAASGGLGTFGRAAGTPADSGRNGAVVRRHAIGRPGNGSRAGRQVSPADRRTACASDQTALTLDSAASPADALRQMSRQLIERA